MEIPASKVKELRGQSGAGIMECKKVLVETQGEIDRALEILKQRGFLQAEKRAKRATTKGLIEAYIHTEGRIGAMVEVNCETDFVARTDEFKELAHNLAMQVAALAPQFISAEEVPEGAEIEPDAVCLLLQPYIKDSDKRVQDIITGTIAKTGENIKISRFARFELVAQMEDAGT